MFGRQGIADIHNRVDSRWHAESLTIVSVFLAVLFLCVGDSFARGCTDNVREGVGYSMGQLGFTTSYSGSYCKYGKGCGGNDFYEKVPYCSSSPMCRQSVIYAGYPTYYYLANCGCPEEVNGCQSKAGNEQYYVICTTRCTDKCAADSVACKESGMAWFSESCECLDPCAKYRAQCEAMQGEFEGRAQTTNTGYCCNAICNLCNTAASKDQWERKVYYCCKNNLAPPELNKCLTDQLPVGCGMTTKFKSNEDNGNCRDPNLSEEASQSFFENCAPTSSSGSATSSSGEGGSSGGGGSSGEGGGSSGQGTQYPEGCEECPWLDSILDTLTAQKRIVSEISDCLNNAEVCLNLTNQTDDGLVDSVYIDSTLFDGIKYLLDSSLEISDEQLRTLAEIDTNLLKMLASDSATRLAIAGAAANIMSSLSGSSTRIVTAVNNLAGDVNGGFAQLNDGVVTMDTAMRRRLDSLLKTIPDDILDSIVKYQDSALDRFDSVLFGLGVGFSLVDSMIDTVVKYFQVSNHYDSMYSVTFGSMDSTLKKISDKMDNLSFGIEITGLSFSLDGPVFIDGMGYGDTASTTLRDDLNAMNGAITETIYHMDTSLSSRIDSMKTAISETINHMDTSVGNELRDLVNEQKGFYANATGYGVSGSSSTLKGDLDGLKGAVDGLDGSIGGVAGSVVRGVDSSLNAGDPNVQMGHLDIPSGDSLAELIGQDAGFNRMDVAGDTAAMNAAINAPIVETDSTTCVGNDCIHYDSDKKINDSLSRVVQRSGDSIKSSNEAFYRDSLTGIISRVKDSIVAINPLGVFDSTLMRTLGAKVPNTNTCPEHCSHFVVNIPFTFGVLNTDLNYRLCVPWGVMGNLNVLQFLRFLIRCIVAVTCITMVMNAAARLRR